MSSLTSALGKTKNASRSLNTISDESVRKVLIDLSAALINSERQILATNQKDCKKMSPTDPRYDRLLLTTDRIAAIANDVRAVAALPSPLHRTLEQRTLPNGLQLTKVSVPLGVIGMIYEARPNVTVDAFALCFKAGNACVLKGGSDAIHSNQALVKIIQNILKKHGIDPHVIHLLPANRTAVRSLLAAAGLVDVIIPRGSQSLIDFVRTHARIPIIETGAGIVHAYIDKSADLRKAKGIVCNAKTRRVSVCNALDTLIIHQEILKDLPAIAAPLQAKNVEIFADPPAYKALKNHYNPSLLNRATKKHFGTEFLSFKLSIKTVPNLDAALAHIQQFGSSHSETIVAEDQKTIDAFLRQVDAAAVYANASTAFTDGAQFGMGAEIGISTQKLHARGPMALPELTSYKWIIRGSGQVREP